MMLGGNCSPCCGSDACLEGVSKVNITVTGLPGDCSYVDGSSFANPNSGFPYTNRSSKSEDGCTFTLFRSSTPNNQNGFTQLCRFDGLTYGRTNTFGEQRIPIRLDPTSESLYLPFVGGYAGTFGPAAGKSFRNLPYDDFVTLTGNFYDNACPPSEFSSLRVRIEAGPGPIKPFYCPGYPYIGVLEQTNCTAGDLAPLFPAALPSASTFISAYNVPIRHCVSCEPGNYYTEYYFSVPKQYNDNGSPCVDQGSDNECKSLVFLRQNAPEDLNLSMQFSGGFQPLSGNYALKFGASYLQGWGGRYINSSGFPALGISVSVEPMGHVMTGNENALDIVLLPPGTSSAPCGHDTISYVLRGSVFYAGNPFNSSGDYTSFAYWNHAFSFYSCTPCIERVCRQLPQVSVSGSKTIQSSVPAINGQTTYSVSSL